MAFSDGDQCPACEIGILVEQEIPLDFLYVTIKGQKSFQCSICRECFTNKDISKKIDAILTETRRQFF
jgi:hypothetical protein